MNDLKNLERKRKQVSETLNVEQQKNVQCLESQDVIQYFGRQIIQETKTEKVVKGYRAKAEYGTATMGEIVRMQENVIKMVTDSMKKVKSKKT